MGDQGDQKIARADCSQQLVNHFSYFPFERIPYFVIPRRFPKFEYDDQLLTIQMPIAIKCFSDADHHQLQNPQSSGSDRLHKQQQQQTHGRLIA